MKTYQYTDATNEVVAIFDEDGLSRMSILASALELPEGAVIEPYVAPPAPVPSIVSRFQARAALAQTGHFEAVAAYMAALPATDIQRLAWEDATNFDRTSTTLAAMATMLGLSETDLDDLFVLAASIEA